MNHEDDENNDNLMKITITSTRIESWNGFEFSLREESRILFHKTLDDCKEYVDAVNSKGESFSAESLFYLSIV